VKTWSSGKKIHKCNMRLRKTKMAGGFSLDLDPTIFLDKKGTQKREPN
jgi:hypothetical protein